jgi:hypothetical protein
VSSPPIFFKYNWADHYRECGALLEEFRKLPAGIARKYIRSSMRRAIKPFAPALRSATPKGRTGNLRRSVRAIVKFYNKVDHGSVVGIVGYSRGGEKKNQKGNHSSIVENGTAERVQKKTGRRCGVMPARRMCAKTLASHAPAILSIVCAEMTVGLEKAAQEAARRVSRGSP